MDGVQFLRRASRSGFEGGLIILRGVGSRILDTALRLAKARKLNVLAALEKPLEGQALEEI
jgi:hypothetical protein